MKVLGHLLRLLKHVHGIGLLEFNWDVSRTFSKITCIQLIPFDFIVLHQVRAHSSIHGTGQILRYQYLIKQIRIYVEFLLKLIVLLVPKRAHGSILFGFKRLGHPFGETPSQSQLIQIGFRFDICPFHLVAEHWWRFGSSEWLLRRLDLNEAQMRPCRISRWFVTRLSCENGHIIQVIHLNGLHYDWSWLWVEGCQRISSIHWVDNHKRDLRLLSLGKVLRLRSRWGSSRPTCELLSRVDFIPKLWG